MAAIRNARMDWGGIEPTVGLDARRGLDFRSRTPGMLAAGKRVDTTRAGGGL
jgi:hypothetical protein